MTDRPGHVEPGPEPGAQAATVGQQLRAAREGAGLSVEQVSADTRIRDVLVRDLEADRFASSGGYVYARGHVRNIAAAVGADPAGLVAEFDRAVGAPPPLPVEAGPGSASVRHHPAAKGKARARAGAGSTRLVLPMAGRPERRGPNWLAAAVAALCVLVVVIAVGTFSGRRAPRTGDGADTVAVTTTGSAASRAPTRPSATAQAPAPDAVAERPAASGAELRVRIIGGASWISVRGSKGTLYEGVVRDGMFKDFKDPKKLTLVVGNAGAVNLVCGGKDVGVAGKGGSVKRFTCSTSGLVRA